MFPSFFFSLSLSLSFIINTLIFCCCFFCCYSSYNKSSDLKGFIVWLLNRQCLYRTTTAKSSKYQQPARFLFSIPILKNWIVACVVEITCVICIQSNLLMAGRCFKFVTIAICLQQVFLLFVVVITTRIEQQSLNIFGTFKFC